MKSIDPGFPCAPTTNRFAPNSLAAASFPLEEEKTVTSAPILAANCTARCPRPPSPMTPALVPRPTAKWLRGEKTVMPPQSRGAAFSESSLEGMRKANLESARMERANPP